MKMAGKVVGMLMNKDIGLVTYYKENYGSILQCYATKNYLEQKGYNCHVLYEKYDARQLRVVRAKNIIFHAYNSLRYKGYFSQYMEMRKSMKKEKGYLTRRAYDFQNKFVEDMLKPQGLTWKELHSIATRDDYIAFIAGSDQIWNASIHINPIYFLQFAPKCKRIALAPSFGINSIPAYNKKTVKVGLEGFERIAVREQTGEEIIGQLCKVPTIQVTDPVFLLDVNQWKSFAESVNTPSKPYIFVHFLSEPSKDTIYEIEKLSNRTSTEVVCFSYGYKEYSIFSEITHLDGDPQEYVSLIRDASYICTDSFHSSVFSIIMHKRFYTFPRQHLHKSPQSSRIIDLLTRYDLEDRYVKSGMIPEEDSINWNAVDTTMENERIVLRKYLDEEIERRS